MDIMFQQVCILGGIFLCGMLVGWNYHASKYSDKLQELLDEMEAEPIRMKVVLTNGIFYASNEETGDFLAQGGTEKELIDALMRRYPNQQFSMSQENSKVFNNDAV